VRVTWLTSADFSANQFGPCAVRYPLDVLAAGDLYDLGWHNAPVFLATPAGWAPPGMATSLAAVSRTHIEGLVATKPRVDIAVTWPLAPKAEIGLRQWDYLALFVADCTLRGDGPMRIDNLQSQARSGAAALLLLLIGRNLAAFEKARSQTRHRLSSPSGWHGALGAVVALDWDGARQHAVTYGDLYDLAEAARIAFNAVTGADVTLKELLSEAFG
jgi:hypothetical protein